MKRLFAIAVLATACAGSGSGNDPTRSTCSEAFSAAAGVDEMADSVTDLYPAVRACGSVAEWTVAFDEFEGAGFTGSAVDVLRNVCLADEVASTALCEQVQ